MQEKVFIIGGTGYLGYHICRELVAQNYLVTALSFDEVPAGFLPDSVTVIKNNINDMTDTELTTIMQGHHYFIFAAGLDDRYTPKAPSYPVFYAANVTSVKRLLELAKGLKFKKAVILNSYFAYFNRIWPEMKLAEKHPYIRSRKEQQEMAFEVGGTEMPVAILELPYIVGVTPTKGSLWKPLVKYVNSNGSLKPYTAGGTAVVSVRNVGLAIANSIKLTTENTIYQVVDVNLTWAQWLERLRVDTGKPIKVVAIPNFLLKTATFLLKLKHKLEGKESGLDMVPFIDLQSKQTYLPLEESKTKLQYGKYDIEEDFRDTVALCLQQ